MKPLKLVVNFTSTAATVAMPQLLLATGIRSNHHWRRRARYEVQHDFAQLLDKTLGITHNVAVDVEVCCTSFTKVAEPENHPSTVFDQKGKFIRAFGSRLKAVATASRCAPRARNSSSACAYQNVKALRSSRSMARWFGKNTRRWMRYSKTKTPNASTLGTRCLHADHPAFLNDGGFQPPTAMVRGASIATTRPNWMKKARRSRRGKDV